MYVIKMINQNANQLNMFVDGCNLAYEERSNANLPFRPITSDILKKEVEEGYQVFGVEQENEMVGGFCLRKEGIIGHISRVWVLPAYQRSGIAKEIMQYAENVAKQQACEQLMLNVAHTYQNAVNLYQKQGYKLSKIYANEPGTFYFMRMVKEVSGKKHFAWKRLVCLHISKIKFYILYREDSTPRRVCRLIYGNHK